MALFIGSEAESDRLASRQGGKPEFPSPQAANLNALAPFSCVMNFGRGSARPLLISSTLLIGRAAARPMYSRRWRGERLVLFHHAGAHQRHACGTPLVAVRDADRHPIGIGLLEGFWV